VTIKIIRILPNNLTNPSNASLPSLPNLQPLYQSLPRQLNLPRRLPSLIPSLTQTQRAPIPYLDLVLLRRERAGAMMRKVHAGEGTGAEVVAAVG